MSSASASASATAWSFVIRRTNWTFYSTIWNCVHSFLITFFFALAVIIQFIGTNEFWLETCLCWTFYVECLKHKTHGYNRAHTQSPLLRLLLVDSKCWVREMKRSSTYLILVMQHLLRFFFPISLVDTPCLRVCTVHGFLLLINFPTQLMYELRTSFCDAHTDREG